MIDGYENLAGQTLGTLKVVQRERLQPLSWRCRCLRCGTEQVHTHIRLQRGATCQNSACGRTVRPDASSGRTGTNSTAVVRARDAEEAARHIREQQPRTLELDPDTKRLIDEIAKWPRGARGL